MSAYIWSTAPEHNTRQPNTSTKYERLLDENRCPSVWLQTSGYIMHWGCACELCHYGDVRCWRSWYEREDAHFVDVRPVARFAFHETFSLSAVPQKAMEPRGLCWLRILPIQSSLVMFVCRGIAFNALYVKSLNWSDVFNFHGVRNRENNLFKKCRKHWKNSSDELLFNKSAITEDMRAQQNTNANLCIPAELLERNGRERSNWLGTNISTSISYLSLLPRQ